MMESNTQVDVDCLDLESSILTPEDALKCITGQVEVKLPMPNVKPCNNLDEYFTKSTHGSTKKQQEQSAGTSGQSRAKAKSFRPSFSKEPFATPLVRNFDKILKEPLDQDASSKPKKIKPDVFSRTEQLEDTSGPLVLLKKRLGQTVKILIRRRRKVPFISRVLEYKGKLVLFDKHMNVYLEDVIESFKYKSDNKLLKRARHRESLMLRGDNIILVS